jgi:hypothetical protein
MGDTKECGKAKRRQAKEECGGIIIALFIKCLDFL